MLVAYLYAPLEAQLQDLVRFIVLPVLVLTRVAMWQAPRILRALKVARGRDHVGQRARSLRAHR